MTLIFGGIDFPVFEMLFIVLALLIVGLVIVMIGLVYILKELRTLKDILREEKVDIQEFESDIVELEKLETGRDNSVALKLFIKNSLGKGFSWEQIKQELVSRGWDETRLNELYKGVK